MTTIFHILLKKIIGRPWITLIVMLGVTAALSIIISIPLYTDAVLQRMLVKDLEIYQEENNEYPGAYSFDADLRYDISSDKKSDLVNLLDSTLFDSFKSDFPVETKTVFFMKNTISCGAFDPLDDSTRRIEFSSIRDIEDHISIIQGNLPESNSSEDVIEVLITEGARRFLNMETGRVYYSDILGSQSVKIYIAGIFTVKNQRDPFWPSSGLMNYNSSIFVNEDILLHKIINKKPEVFKGVSWKFLFDYHNLTTGDMTLIKKFIRWQETLTAELGGILSADFVIKDSLAEYEARSSRLMISLWVLAGPSILIILFFIFMLSVNRVNIEQNEISVFSSRGFPFSGIIKIYLLEIIILSVIGLFISPFIGQYFCRIIGASSGFLNFVQREQLTLNFKLSMMIYPFIGMVLIIVAYIIPVIGASGLNIVSVKKTKKKAFWKRFYLDLIFLIISIYGFFQLSWQQGPSVSPSGSFTMDPLLFAASSLFIFGCGLFFLRIYPSVIILVFNLGKKKWKPVPYCTLLQVSRGGFGQNFIMLFLIFGISAGLYSALAARTINYNTEQGIYYSNGADVVIEPEWFDREALSEDPWIIPDPQETRWVEPPFAPYQSLNGVDQATRVFRDNSAEIYTGNFWENPVSLYGIVPSEFGKTGWVKNSLFSVHWFNYLNWLTEIPSGVLLSSNFKESGIEIGDTVTLRFGEDHRAELVVCAFIEYWPGFDPGINNSNKLAVTNLQILQMEEILPYQIWINRNYSINTESFYNEIELAQLNYSSIVNTRQMIIASRNDPYLQGLNGVLTLSFLISIGICMIGFLIYWILSFYSRKFSFGILRALGLSSHEVRRVLFFEQILITGSSIAAGFLVGDLTGFIYIPLLKNYFTLKGNAPPFTVIGSIADYCRIGSIIFLFLIICILVLSGYLKKLDISSTIKMGEE